MSVQDDVAVLVRAVGKGATVDERVAALVGKMRGLLQGMRMNVTDPDVRGMLDEAAAALGRHSEAIVMAVTGQAEDNPPAAEAMHFPAQPPRPPQPDEDMGLDEPEPEPDLPAIRHASAKKKPVAKRARR